MFLTQCKRFLRDETASIAIEYAVLAAILGVLWMISGRHYVDEVSRIFKDISNELDRIRI